MMNSTRPLGPQPANTPNPATQAVAKARAAATNALVEAAARAAMQADKPPPDLLTAGFPFEPAYWMIVVEPLQPRNKSDGGIEVVDVSMEAEAYQMTVGRILKVGPACMEGQTTGGVKLDNYTRSIRTPEELIGKYVVYQKHVGQELVLRETGQIIKAMKLTETLGVTDDPYAWKFYI
jgi:hypothetical protein